MKRTLRSASKVLAVYAFGSLLLASCAKKSCPTYMAPLERVKSMKGMEINGSWERKSVPSPKQAKRKYMVEADTLVAAGSRMVFYGLPFAFKEI